MALPSKTDLVAMDYAYLGEPFVYVPANSTIDTSTMDYAYLGQPFVTNPDTVSGWTHKIDGITNANIGKVNGIAKTSITKINGV